MADYYVVPKSALTATADAIKEKTGSEEEIEFTKDGFKDAVEAIETGGGGTVEPEEKDVDFIDYDGTLLYSYTATEFLAMTEMPANPSREGLVAQGWNWTMEDAKQYVNECGFLVIGQNYTTDDGSTRIYITISDSDVDALGPQYLYMCTYDVGASFTIDWGDGVIEDEEIKNADRSQLFSHTYTERGQFIIKLYDISSNVILGYHGTNNGIAYNNNPLTSDSIKRVTKIEVGNNIVAFGNQPFINLMNLESVSIPKAVLNVLDISPSIGGPNKMRGIVLPDGFTSVSHGNQVCSLRYLALPKTIEELSGGFYLWNVEKLVIPNGVTSVGAYTLRNAQLLKRLHLPAGVTEYPAWFAQFINSPILSEITVPSGVVSIGAQFMANTRLLHIRMKPQVPPTLANVNAFPNLSANTIIYVPYSADHSILEAYKAATNWSTWANLMEEEPQ